MINDKSRLHGDTVQSPAQVHIKDSAFLNDLSDEISLLKLLLPGGNHVFKMKNVTFSGDRQANGEAVIMAPQDCGIKKMKENWWNPGGMATLCNVHYHFEDVDFSRVRKMPGTNVAWVGNAFVGSPTAPVYISHDGSLADNRFLISSLYDGFKKVDGCFHSDDPWFEGAIACDKEEVKIARLIIWTSSSKGFTGIE